MTSIESSVTSMCICSICDSARIARRAPRRPMPSRLLCICAGASGQSDHPLGVFSRERHAFEKNGRNSIAGVDIVSADVLNHVETALCEERGELL